MAAAGLVQVGGSPILIEHASAVAPVAAFRLGRPAAGAVREGAMNIPHFAVIRVGDTVHPIGADGLTHLERKRPCAGRFRAKALRVTNSLRKALGMPLITLDDIKIKEPIALAHAVHIPTMHVGPSVPKARPVRVHHHPGQHPHPHGRHGHPYHMRILDQPFAERIHFALSSLGPWEGRAVAFVLGCGIGVLLRMFWVLVVISYRLIRGTRSEEQGEYQHILFEQYDAEDLVVPPPSFTYVDEKVPVVEFKDEKKAVVEETK